MHVIPAGDRVHQVPVARSREPFDLQPNNPLLARARDPPTHGIRACPGDHAEHTIVTHVLGIIVPQVPRQNCRGCD